VAVRLLTGYAVLTAGMLVMQVRARRRPPRPATLGQVAAGVVGAPGARWVLLRGWAWLGWYLFVRTTPG
jgi:hypothetical protein